MGLGARAMLLILSLKEWLRRGGRGTGRLMSRKSLGAPLLWQHGGREAKNVRLMRLRSGA